MPLQLNDSRATGYSGLRVLAVAIRKLNAEQNHAAILRPSPEEGKATVLHLRWHKDVRAEITVSSKYHWVEPDIPFERLVVVAALCHKVHEATIENRIPYGFSPPENCFDDQSGAFLYGPKRLGLTCASFVLGIFDCAGIPLLDYDSWPTDRRSDIEWQYGIIKELKAVASPAFIEKVSGEVGNARYRPEEVIAAVVSGHARPTYGQVEPHVAPILHQLG